MRHRVVWLSVLGIAMCASCGTLSQCDAADSRYIVETAYGKVAGRKLTEKVLRFARHGNPNHEALPEWPKFDAPTRATMLFQGEPRVVEDPGEELRLAWQASHRARRGE
jgi:carboxylesterase type B